MNTAAHSHRPSPLRWGIVGTGSIANWMAEVIGSTPAARLSGVASRRPDSGKAFAKRHGAGRSFDSWADMLDWEGIDAVYIATPTVFREAIGVAAARAGKHVLGEKPFADLPSLRRITAACRENDVAFMDATHFVHHPRTASIRQTLADEIGNPLSVDSAFMISLPDRNNIRYDTTLEPMGAVGDLGWYNMRALVEFLPPGADPYLVKTVIRRDAGTGAAVSGCGLLAFDGGITSNWGCRFDAGADVMQLRIVGRDGAIELDNFIGQDADGSASFQLRHGGGPAGAVKSLRIASEQPGPALMFEDFVAAAADPALRKRWRLSAERTQQLLDAVWEQANGG